MAFLYPLPLVTWWFLPKWTLGLFMWLALDNETVIHCFKKAHVNFCFPSSSSWSSFFFSVDRSRESYWKMKHMKQSNQHRLTQPRLSWTVLLTEDAYLNHTRSAESFNWPLDIWEIINGWCFKSKFGVLCYVAVANWYICTLLSEVLL